MHKMRMDQVGSEGSDLSSQAEEKRGVHMRPGWQRNHPDASLPQWLGEPLPVTASEKTDPRVCSRLSQPWQDLKQLTFAPSYATGLLHV